MGFCNASLGLGLGYNKEQETCSQSDNLHEKKKPSLKYDHLVPCLTLGLPEETFQSVTKIDRDVHRQASSLSPVSSFSNSSVKKERESCYGEEVDAERVSSRACDDDEEASPRKKLRLSKEQSIILEDSFKEHSTLNPKQKASLGRAAESKATTSGGVVPKQESQVSHPTTYSLYCNKTKLKQTEVDCELLKKCCETLTEENKRLQKELQELKSLKLAGPLYMQLPAATLTMCPSCEKIGSGGGGGGSSASTFSIVGTRPPFYDPITHQSTPC